MLSTHLTQRKVPHQQQFMYFRLSMSSMYQQSLTKMAIYDVPQRRHIALIAQVPNNRSRIPPSPRFGTTQRTTQRVEAIRQHFQSLVSTLMLNRISSEDRNRIPRISRPFLTWYRFPFQSLLFTHPLMIFSRTKLSMRISAMSLSLSLSGWPRIKTMSQSFPALPLVYQEDPRSILGLPIAAIALTELRFIWEFMVKLLN